MIDGYFFNMVFHWRKVENFVKNANISFQVGSESILVLPEELLTSIVNKLDDPQDVAR